MRVRLTAEIDERAASVRVKSIQVDDGALLSIPKAGVNAYSSALLLVFTAYRLWAQEGRADAEFHLAAPNYPSEVIKRFIELVRNSRDRGSREDPHWSHSLFQVRDAELNETVDLFEILDGSEGLRARPKCLEGRNVEILVRNRRLDDTENIDGFMKLVRLLTDVDGQRMFRFGGIRENLTYKLSFADSPFHNALEPRYRTESYKHFHAEVEFDRLSLSERDYFVIGLVDKDRDLAKSIAETTKGVIYREVFSVQESDRDRFHEWWHERMHAPKEMRQGHMNSIFPVRAWVNNVAATFEKAFQESGRYYLKFLIPKECLNKLKLRFRMVSDCFQVATQTAIPMIVSEPTRYGSFELNYRSATIENVGFFVGAHIGPDQDRPEIHHSPENYTFSISTGSSFLNPGEGALVHWTPIMRRDRVKLVRLKE